MNILNIKHSLSLLMFFLLLFSGCATKVDRLEYALEFAGENRRELEKVLEYYSDDSLKFRAACFLIENMPRWYASVSYTHLTLPTKRIVRSRGLGDVYKRQGMLMMDGSWIHWKY